MQVSVIIPTHNRPDQLEVILAALRRQTLPADEYEIIVVDDGSIPPVTLPGDGERPRQTLIRLEGVERSIARNTGAEVAQGDLLVFLDDDFFVQPDFLECHLRAYLEWPRVKVLSTGKDVLPEEVLTHPFGRFRQRLELQSVPHERGLVDRPEYCAANNMSISRPSFQELGGFDPAMASSEDQDLAIRHKAHGGRLAYLSDAVGIHRDHANDARSYCRRHEWGGLTIVPFVQRHPERPENVERRRLCGPVRWGIEPLPESLRKLAKIAFGKRPVLAVLFAAARVLEQVRPDGRLLDRLYQMLIGIHIYKGYRRGLAKYGPVPLEPFRAPEAVTSETLS